MAANSFINGDGDGGSDGGSGSGNGGGNGVTCNREAESLDGDSFAGVKASGR